MDMERRGWHTQATGIIQLLNKEEDMMKEAYAQSIECEEPCEGRLSRTVLWEGEGETPSLYSTYDPRERHKMLHFASRNTQHPLKTTSISTLFPQTLAQSK